MSLSQYAAHFAASARRNLTEGDGRCAGSTLPVRCEGCDGRRTDVLTNRPRRFLRIRIRWINEAWCASCYWRDVKIKPRGLDVVWWLPGSHPTTWGALLQSLPATDDELGCDQCEGRDGPVEYLVFPPFQTLVDAYPFCSRCFDSSRGEMEWAPGTSAAYVGKTYTATDLEEKADAAYDARVALAFAKDGK